MWFARLAVFAVLLAWCSSLVSGSFVAEDVSKSYSVRFNPATTSFEIENGIHTSAEAWGTYTRNVTGGLWNYLDIYTPVHVRNLGQRRLQHRALGFLEGYASCADIQQFYGNFYSAVFGTDMPGKGTIGFVRENFAWMRSMVEKNPEDEYWVTIGNTLQQIEGMYEGYVSGCHATAHGFTKDETREFIKMGSVVGGDKIDPQLINLDHPTLEHFLLINAWGDLYQIALKYVEPGMNARRMGGPKGTDPEKRKLIERCSAIVKLLDDRSDVVFGHATWDTFESLAPRIIKHYNFGIPSADGQKDIPYNIMLSSSPAVLSSVDDFFVFNGRSNMAVIETTNSLYNVRLLELVVPQSVLSWARALTSHQLAVDGATWAENFSRYHSGTYTNQWMAIDFAHFTPGQNPETGFFTVLEEVPGLIHTEDMTHTLVNQTYWPSYNTPYFADVFEESGYARACQFNDENCYGTAPRAQIFKKYQSTVQDLESAQWILSYNDFAKDILESKDDSCNAIACRGDLQPVVDERGAFGALDAKVGSVMKSKGTVPTVWARLGPTHDEQPVFCWSQLPDESQYVHHGHPDCFDYDWIVLPATA